MKSSECEYKILNPCAEADPIPPRGISPRLTNLADKTIGLYAIARKSAARPILSAVEQRLKERGVTPGLDESRSSASLQRAIARLTVGEKFKRRRKL